MTTTSDSLATGQRSLGDPSVRYPLWPPLTTGCPATATEHLAYPVEVDYAYDRVDPALFDRTAPVPAGLDRWAPLLPPLHAPGLGEGRTPLVPIGPGLYVKDESRNPTWSHKDRLNRVTVSAALGAGAPGIVAASSGNHGASAAAYAARAGLPCVVLASATMPGAVASFLQSYGAVVLPVEEAARWPLMRRIVERTGFHPVSNTTVTHTGHGFGPEGYKTVAYEIYLDLGVPDAVFVPTGYGELLFGVWKGFTELRRLGLTDRLPRIFSCEPATAGPLAAAVRAGRPAARVGTGPTDAYAISCEVGGFRGVLALERDADRALLVDDRQLRAAQGELARQGLWVELSAAAGLAGFTALEGTGAFDGAAVCVTTSSGFKDRAVGNHPVAPVDATWSAVEARLAAAGITV
ncbi:pyridoxal-phosphate dependent enzyme [Kitasatospora sp. NPDC048540]|uniref:threonine synthase n=1 Tax=unclassified Kitasatospora TaxID=2633591 RepID=UPI000AF021C4|nr:pyridoxal-phosphate dependent enzyme [Kitasatospora sp. MBT63]